MSNKGKRHVGEFLKSGLANSDRIAGMGISYDDYSEDSLPGEGEQPLTRDAFMGYPVGKTRTQEEHDALYNSPVTTYNLKDLEEGE